MRRCPPAHLASHDTDEPKFVVDTPAGLRCKTMAAADGPVCSGSHYAKVARSERNENMAEKD